MRLNALLAVVVASTGCQSAAEIPSAPKEPRGKQLLAGYDRAFLECDEIGAADAESEFGVLAKAWAACTSQALGVYNEQRRALDPSASERLAVTLLETKPGAVHAKIGWGSAQARGIVYECLAEVFVNRPLSPTDSCAAVELRIRTASAL